MIYKNSRTGETMDVKSKIHGGYWQAVEPATTTDSGEEKEDGETKKPSRAKKGGKEQNG